MPPNIAKPIYFGPFLVNSQVYMFPCQPQPALVTHTARIFSRKSRPVGTSWPNYTGYSTNALVSVLAAPPSQYPHFPRM